MRYVNSDYTPKVEAQTTNDCSHPFRTIHSASPDGHCSICHPDATDEKIEQEWESDKGEVFETVLREKLEELFPKGECAERGAALVLYAEAVILMKNLTKK